MRTIKFRAWDSEKQKKYVPNVLSFVGGKVSSLVLCDDGNRKYIEHELMQFTGLTDKNGKELYSDDLFKDEKGVLYRCYNVVGGFAHSLPQFTSTLNAESAWPLQPLSDEQTVSWFKSNCEVIGNIHDNPELISQLS